MFPNQVHSRRQFMRIAGAGSVLLGTAGFLTRSSWADPTQLAARIEQAGEQHPLMPAIEKAFAALQALQPVKDYTAIFLKEERIGRNLTKSRMELKVREQPYSVYLKFLSPSAGREALYVEGQNRNLMQAHDVGFRGLAGTVSLEPTGTMAMEGNHHPITLIGMRHLAEQSVEQWLDQTKLQGATVNIFANSSIGNTSCTLVESSYSRPQAGIKFQLTRLYIDNQLGYPIRLQQFDFPSRRGGQPDLSEDYMYTNIKTNVGLQDIDFDTRNRNYAF